jgi:3-oxoacyl-[acyl-carrier-protein] synthase II
MKRVVITGIGVITSIGQSREELWTNLLAEKSGIRVCDRFDTSQARAKCAAQVDHFDPLALFSARRLKRLDRYSQMALAGAKLAIMDAGLEVDPGNRRDRFGVCAGTALGGISPAESQHELFLRQGPDAINPMLALLVFGGASSSNIAIDFGFTGANQTNSNSCASGTMAIGDALRLIRAGHADVILAGGAEAPLCPLTFTAFDVIRTMSSQIDPLLACRPFDRNRDGFVMGEGAGMLVMESLEHARARGATIFAEVAGYSCNSDAHHMTGSLQSGECAARCMLDAIKDAGVAIDQIDYINPHASSTPMNDRNETTAIRRAFGTHADRLLVAGTKGYHGHPLGATGAIEAAITALALHHQFVPANLGLREPDPECDLPITRSGRPATLGAALSNSFGFGWINATLVLKRFL